jgi:hypothetical protein
MQCSTPNEPVYRHIAGGTPGIIARTYHQSQVLNLLLLPLLLGLFLLLLLLLLVVTGERVFAATVGMEVRRTKVTGLKPATTYNIYVGALWPGGAGDNAMVQVTTNATPAPAPPAAKSAVPAGGKATSHEATSHVPAGATATAAATGKADAGHNPPASKVQHDSNTAPAWVADSAPGCQPNKEPKAPVDFTATADSSNSIKLTYGNADTSICMQFYSIDAYELKTGDRIAEIQTVYNAYTLTGLRQGVEYVFTVSAVNSAGDSVPDTAYCSI